jgi:hypothetical protein
VSVVVWRQFGYTPEEHDRWVGGAAEHEHRRKVGVGCYDHALVCLRGLEDLRVGGGDHFEIGNVHDVMADWRRGLKSRGERLASSRSLM